jgi:hypothetical protein
VDHAVTLHVVNTKDLIEIDDVWESIQWGNINKISHGALLSTLNMLPKHFPRPGCEVGPDTSIRDVHISAQLDHLHGPVFGFSRRSRRYSSAMLSSSISKGWTSSRIGFSFVGGVKV